MHVLCRLRSRTVSERISWDHCSEGWSCWTFEHNVSHDHPSLQWSRQIVSETVQFLDQPGVSKKWHKVYGAIILHPDVTESCGFQHNVQKKLPTWKGQCFNKATKYSLFCCWQLSFLKKNTWSLRQVRDRNKVHVKPVVQSQEDRCSMHPLEEWTTDDIRLSFAFCIIWSKFLTDSQTWSVTWELIDGAIEHWSKWLSLAVCFCGGYIEHVFLSIWTSNLSKARETCESL